VVFQFHSYDSEREVSKSSYIPISREVEVPPAKAWWCPEEGKGLFVVEKLKYHRLKPGGVQRRAKGCL
jgi:hypothetical protein